MSLPLLPSYSFQISYGPKDDRLKDFYLPALERSVSFDRSTGFFSSASLAIAAAGIVRLIGNGGRMRLLCGAQLSPADVEAVRKGEELKGIVEKVLVGCLADPSDGSMKARLEALAWMVAQGTLEMRVVLPKGKDGHPLAVSEAREYYHPKEGLFQDAEGNRLAFSGSSNESENGWQWNYEVFSVYTTWPRGMGEERTPALKGYVNQVAHRFEALWEGREDGWIALEIPDAAREKLLCLAPSQAPTRDALEPPEVVPPIVLPLARKRPAVKRPGDGADAAVRQRERLVFRFLREAPFLPGADRIGIETSTVRPWPHQLHVIGQTVARYPESFLFCDEVGLGKTVEAGLALRQLVLTGKMRRALLLTPKSVLKQWQEELYEKAVLNIPRYDGGQALDYFDRPVPFEGPVWEIPILLASSQLAKREERQVEILAATPWDLVLVDEAHHARRKDFLTDRYRPNRLMELLAGNAGRPGLRSRTKCLYLLTATPMQVDPVEVWDLLKVLGLGGRWGAVQENFLDFYAALREPASTRDWEHLLTLVDDELKAGGALDPAFAEKAERALGLVSWSMLKSLPGSSKKKASVAKLSEVEKTWLAELVRRHTPLRRMMWRNTRRLLRRYKEKGLLSGNVPRRDPKNVWIALQEGPGSERELYDRIEEYITDFYRKYEAERKGLGFVMTVYRRRLTSSFAALTKSLEKRAAYLRGARSDAGFTDDDLEQEELDRDVLEELTAEMSGNGRDFFKGEMAFVEDFLHDLRELGSDSKFEQLVSDLAKLFKKFETVLVFTQYTDTMDDLRERLRLVYGSQVACYSGRGGELWDGVAWVSRSKEEIKEEFRLGERVKLLLCTEAASEGLNLQTCGVLINYDMPWNPMRVEQRIGRIDRIGQTFETVHLRNYFLAHTVEATVYQRLEDRIGWFEDVVGELQPILNRVGRTIEELAMLHGADRVRRLEEEMAKLRAELDEKAAQGLDLDSVMEEMETAASLPPPPVTLQQLETALVGSRTVGRHLRPDPEHLGAHVLTWKGVEHRVTFRADLFDRYPNSLELLSYGNPLLDELLEAPGEPEGPGGPRGVAFLKSDGDPRVSLFVGPGDGNDAVGTLQRFEELIDDDGSWRPGDAEEARRQFERVCSDARDRHEAVRGNQRRAEILALEERARRTLVHTALVRIAESAAGDLFSGDKPSGFGSDAVPALAALGVPFKGLLKVAGSCPPALATDPFYASIQGRAAAVLTRKLGALREEGHEVLARYAELLHVAPVSEKSAAPEPEIVWLATSRMEKDAPGREATTAQVLQFRRLEASDVEPFVNAIPLFDLAVAAGLFGPERGSDGNVEEELRRGAGRYEWVETLGRIKPGPGLFVAQVTGESMNRRIPNGSYCVFRVGPQGSKHGSVVLAQHRSVSDVETGGHFSVKVYSSEKEWLDVEQWRHTQIVLRPDSTDPGFQPIAVTEEAAGECTIVAVLVEVLD